MFLINKLTKQKIFQLIPVPEKGYKNPITKKKTN